MTREEAIKTWLPIISMGIDNMPELKEAFDMAIKALEQKSFINKPCVSEKQCAHDKNNVLDKLRAELHATAEMHEDGDYYLRDEWIDEYFDKYKAESEGKE